MDRAIFLSRQVTRVDPRVTRPARRDTKVIQITLLIRQAAAPGVSALLALGEI